MDYSKNYFKLQRSLNTSSTSRFMNLIKSNNFQILTIKHRCNPKMQHLKVDLCYNVIN